MINSLIEAVAKRLKELFPDKKICTEKITSDAEGKIFIIVNNPNQKRELGKMRKRSISFDISYVCNENDNTSYYEWIDKMYEGFEYLKTDTDTVIPENVHTDKFDGIYHFLFDVKYHIYYKEEMPKMEKLFMERRL